VNEPSASHYRSSRWSFCSTGRKSPPSWRTTPMPQPRRRERIGSFGILALSASMPAGVILISRVRPTTRRSIQPCLFNRSKRPSPAMTPSWVSVFHSPDSNRCKTCRWVMLGSTAAISHHPQYSESCRLTLTTLSGNRRKGTSTPSDKATCPTLVGRRGLDRKIKIGPPFDRHIHAVRADVACGSVNDGRTHLSGCTRNMTGLPPSEHAEVPTADQPAGFP
jgi:hypothetical protein